MDEYKVEPDKYHNVYGKHLNKEQLELLTKFFGVTPNDLYELLEKNNVS